MRGLVTSARAGDQALSLRATKAPEVTKKSLAAEKASEKAYRASSRPRRARATPRPPCPGPRPPAWPLPTSAAPRATPRPPGRRNPPRHQPSGDAPVVEVHPRPAQVQHHPGVHLQSPNQHQRQVQPRRHGSCQSAALQDGVGRGRREGRCAAGRARECNNRGDGPCVARSTMAAPPAPTRCSPAMTGPRSLRAVRGDPAASHEPDRVPDQFPDGTGTRDSPLAVRA